MPITIQDNGSANLVEADEDVLAAMNGSITLNGDGNRVTLGRPYLCQSITVHASDGATISLGESCVMGNLLLFARDAATLTIGRECAFNGDSQIMLHEHGRVAIGQNCLFGGNLSVMNSDMHSICDLETGERINPARDVTIGDRVWIGAQSIILKGSSIESGSVVGMGSIVNGRIPGNCVAAGRPASVVRTGICWQHALIPSGAKVDR